MGDTVGTTAHSSCSLETLNTLFRTTKTQSFRQKTALARSTSSDDFKRAE